MRCDLHVHTDRSGMCTVPVARRFCQESYNDPREVYELLKRRGMDLVTVTDHDSIDAAECLRHHPDFFLSEEVTGITPSGTEVHIGVFDVTERDHIELQRRRNDMPSLLAYLQARGLLFAINHVFSALTGRRTDADFALFQDFFPAMETLNGQLLAACNREAEALCARWRKIPLGGQRFAHPGRIGQGLHGGAWGALQKRLSLRAKRGAGSGSRPFGRLLAVDPRCVEHRAVCSAPPLLGLPADAAGRGDSRGHARELRSRSRVRRFLERPSGRTGRQLAALVRTRVLRLSARPIRPVQAS